MTEMKKMALMGEILQRVGALGDAKLAGMLGELMAEVGKETEPVTTAPVGQKYVVCVEATMQDGTKLQHPLIGGNYMPRSIEDYKMMVGDNLVALQRETQGMAAMVEQTYRQVHVRYVPVTDAALATLEEKLRNLLENLLGAIDTAAAAKAEAYGMMNVPIEAEDITDDMLSDIMRKTLYAGAALTEAGEVVDRTEGESYIEEDEIEANRTRKDDDYDEYEDEYGDDEYEDEYEDDEYEDDYEDDEYEDSEDEE